MGLASLPSLLVAQRWLKDSIEVDEPPITQLCALLPQFTFCQLLQVVPGSHVWGLSLTSLSFISRVIAMKCASRVLDAIFGRLEALKLEISLGRCGDVSAGTDTDISQQRTGRTGSSSLDPCGFMADSPQSVAEHSQVYSMRAWRTC